MTRPLLVAIGFALFGCGDPDRIVLDGDLVGHCEYTSPFTNGPECRDYLGTWSLDEAEADCTKLKSTFKVDTSCPDSEVLGYCLTDVEGQQMRTHVLGTDPKKCGSSKTGCQFFGGGYWEADPICGGDDAEELVILENYFPQATLICSDPVEGEGPGQSQDDKVCTWEIISGATEEGRVFSDYASCDPVRIQRPYSPVPPFERYDTPDPRMDDPDYAADVSWVKSQLRSSACICCHDSTAPNGPSVFDLDSPGNMLNQFSDRGIAMGTGWISTVGFGAYPPEQNNGFTRADLDDPNDSIFPTTDMDRMISIFLREAAHRDIEASDFADEQYGAGPLDTIRSFEPSECSPEEGITADGVLQWLPGRARYVYVLEADTISPSVPPNLDTPDGTIWRIDLDPDAYPVGSETIRYGEIPLDMVQKFPADGSAPAALEKGKRYYLYVTADILFPITRCIMTIE
jgi:hypothetical protein